MNEICFSSLIPNSSETAREKFFKSKSSEFEKFTLVENSEAAIAGENKLLSERVASISQRHELIVSLLGEIKGASVGESIYRFLSGNGVSFGFLRQAAAELLTVEFLLRNSDSILAASSAACAEIEKEYLEFRQANHATLKRLGRLD